MFGTTSTGTGNTLGRSASFSFSQPPATKPFAGTSGGFTFGGGGNNSTNSAGGATSQPAAGFSFGAPPKPATTATPAGGLGGGLFGAGASGSLTNASQPGQLGGGGGLFGTASTSLQQQQPQQQPQQQQQSTQAAGGGLFGSTSTQASGGGGLFGSSTNPSSGGLFGSTQTKPGGFSFGSSTTQPQASTGAGFGSTGGGGLFGSSTTAGRGLFGANANGGLGGGGGGTGGGLFGQGQVGGFQQPQQVAQAQQAASPFLRFGYYQKERFNDLPEDARKLVEELDKHISSQLQIKDELKTKDFGAEIRKSAAEWQELDSVLKSLSATLESDSNQARDVAERVERDRTDNATLYAIAANAREGRSDGSGFAEWLQTYFAKLAEEFRGRIQRYRNGMETIERHLQSLDHRDQYTPQAISDVIHAQHSSFMSLAAEVASLHGEVETLKRDYAKWYHQTHRSFRDPFGSMGQLAGSVPQ